MPISRDPQKWLRNLCTTPDLFPQEETPITRKVIEEVWLQEEEEEEEESLVSTRRRNTKDKRGRGQVWLGEEEEEEEEESLVSSYSSQRGEWVGEAWRHVQPTKAPLTPPSFNLIIMVMIMIMIMIMIVVILVLSWLPIPSMTILQHDYTVVVFEHLSLYCLIFRWPIDLPLEAPDKRKFKFEDKFSYIFSTQYCVWGGRWVTVDGEGGSVGGFRPSQPKSPPTARLDCVNVDAVRHWVKVGFSFLG